MIAATAFVLGAVAISGGVYASEVEKQNPMNSLVSAIASKFNLNTSEVKSVVDGVMKEHHEEMQQKHKEMFSEKLSKAVTNGELTQAQANLILAKITEVASAREVNKESFKDLTASERKEKMKKHQEDIKEWIKDNNIPQKYAYLLRGMGHKGMGLKGPNSHVSN